MIFVGPMEKKFGKNQKGIQHNIKTLTLGLSKYSKSLNSIYCDK